MATYNNDNMIELFFYLLQEHVIDVSPVYDESEARIYRIPLGLGETDSSHGAVGHQTDSLA